MPLLAALLTLGLFAFWTALGYSLLAPREREQSVPALLLAPVVGVAVTLLPIFTLNQFGLPVRSFGPTLAVALLLGLVARWWWARPVLDLPRYSAFAGVLLLALFLTGWPMLEFGFEWLSFCNEDMTHYCLNAHRILDAGFNDFPTDAAIYGGRDYAQFEWFLFVGTNARAGSDLLLAWVISWAGLVADEAFMPVILAFHLVLVSAVGAMVWRGKEDGRQAWWACLLLAASPLTSFGALAQLFGQVLGLAFLAANVAVLFRPVEGLDRGQCVRRGLLVALLGAGLLIVYSEVFPFLALSYFFYLALTWKTWRAAPRPLLLTLSVGAVGCVLLLNRYAEVPARFILSQFKHGTDNLEAMAAVFPYYLLPSGVANLWGLAPLVAPVGRDLTIEIYSGAALLVVAGGLAVWLARRAHPAAILTCTMMLVTAFLVLTYNAFGLFKIAMFVQPFLLATVVAACWQRLPPLVRPVPLLVLAAVALPTQHFYVDASRGLGTSFVEIPQASSSKVGSQVRHVLDGQSVERVVVDSYNPSLSRLLTLRLRGIEASFPSNVGHVGSAFRTVSTSGSADVRRAMARFSAGLVEREPKHEFDLHDPEGPTLANQFRMRVSADGKGLLAAGGHLLTCTSRTSILNRYRAGEGVTAYLELRPWGEVQNHLLFQPSKRGQLSFAIADPKTIAFHQLETDLIYPESTWAATGRHILFQVVNPTPQVRFCLSMTAMFQSDGKNRLPPAAAVGSTRALFPMLGRGSARVFSPPLAVQRVDGVPCIALDMGMFGTAFPDLRQGVMRLYGTRLTLDHRELVGFLRDISLISDEAYGKFEPPARLESFPKDLKNPDLEYSGLYEDGWVSEAAFFALGAPGGPATLMVRGQVPVLNDPSFTTEARVLLDGKEIARRTVGVGDFEISVPVSAARGRQRVELRFSRFRSLPAPDGRPVVALLSHVGFTAYTGTPNLARR